MNAVRKGFASRSIASRLLLWFMLMSLVPCGVLTVVIYLISVRSLEESLQRGLRVIAEAKASAVEKYASERLSDVQTLAFAPGVVQACAQMAAMSREPGATTQSVQAVVEKYRPLFTSFADSIDYPNLYVLSPSGQVLLELNKTLNLGENLTTGPLKDSELAQVFDRSRTLLQSEMSDYQKYPGVRDAAAFIASPVLDNGRVVAVLILQLNNDDIYKVFSDYNGLGETGEVLVGSRQANDDVIYVAPLRNDPSAAFNRKIHMGDNVSMPLQRAVTGQRGYGEGSDYRLQNVVAVWTYLPSFRWGMVVKQDQAEAYELIYRLRTVMISLLVVTLVPVIIVALVVARGISRPIKLAADVAKQVASGDLTARVNVLTHDETGQLLSAIATMTQYLNALLSRIQKSSVALMSTATEIAATSRQQEQTVQEFTTSTNESVAAVKQISATSQELLKTMDDVNTVAGQTADMATLGQANLSGMEKTMRQLAGSTSSISGKLSVISERAGNINVVVTTITKVADQTNLLSINAAIEAEKAGEYGLGFLVVAREIRRLADQTAVATLEIERMVKEMQYSVSAGVMEMDKFTEEVRQGVQEIGTLSGQFAQIITAVQQLTQRFEVVNEGMRAQSQGADQIREAMVRLSDGAGTTSQSLKEFNKATDHLRDAVGGLKEEVSRFRIDDHPGQERR